MRPMLVGACRIVMRDPFVIFLLVAVAIFALYWAATMRVQTIDVPVSVQRSLADDYKPMTGHTPTAKAEAKIVADYVADEVLFRDAINRGFHLTDKTARQRLVDRARFMIAGAPPEPTEEQLIGYYAEHGGLYRSEPRLTLEHVFFEKSPAGSAALLARLRRGDIIQGDDFWMGRNLPDYGVSMVRGMFGIPFLKATQSAPFGQWSGPIQSIRGFHFVRVTAHGAPALLPYTAVRDQVRQDFTAAQTGD